MNTPYWDIYRDKDGFPRIECFSQACSEAWKIKYGWKIKFLGYVEAWSTFLGACTLFSKNVRVWLWSVKYQNA